MPSFIGLFFGLSLLYIPSALEWDEEPMSGLEYWVSGAYLGKWVWWVFPLFQIGFLFPLLLVTHGAIHIIAIVMVLLIGAFSYLSGIAVIPKGRGFRYIHHPHNARRIGLVQLVVATICFVIFLYARFTV